MVDAGAHRPGAVRCRLLPRLVHHGGNGDLRPSLQAMAGGREPLIILEGAPSFKGESDHSILIRRDSGVVITERRSRC